MSGLILAAMATYTLIGFGPATGTVAPLSYILPGLVPLFGVAGYVIAGRLEKSDPQRFANMGANRA